MNKTLPNPIRLELRRQHACIAEALQDLLRLASDADPRALQLAWSAFERELFQHLEFEETSLFPVTEEAYPDEVRAMRADHDRIRDVVCELGLLCDLHAVRKRAVERLVSMLRRHGEREDATLYRWVDEQAPVETRRHLLRLFMDTARSEFKAGSAKANAGDRPTTPVSPSRV
jgi:hemerythrin-like domain-containing protein